MKTLVAAIILLSLRVLICPVSIETEPRDWIYSLDALPATVRVSLGKITDQRSNFSSSCSVMPGQASRLLTKARRTPHGWIVFYEYGGIVSGHALVSITERHGTIVVSEPVYLNDKK